MTRKRFIKLLMAKGYSRNEANSIARNVNPERPYFERYVLICLTSAVPDVLAEMRERLQRTCDAIAAAAMPAIKQLADSISSFAAAISAATPGIIENMNRLQEADEGTPSDEEKPSE